MNLFRKLNVSMALIFAVALVGVTVFADVNTDFSLKINPGALIVDIVNPNTYESISSPIYKFNEVGSSLTCLTGNNSPSLVFGSSTYLDDSENLIGGSIYIQNPDSANNGFSVSLAATGGTSSSLNNGVDGIAYNAGDCDLGNRNIRENYDVIGGRMYVDPSSASISNGQCSAYGICNSNGLSLGSASSFDYGTVDSITLLQSNSSASRVADYVVNGINISQTIPEGTKSGDYSIDMTMSIIGLSGNNFSTLRSETPIVLNVNDSAGVEGTDLYIGPTDSITLIGAAPNITWSIFDEGSVSNPPYLSDLSGISTTVYNDIGMNPTNVVVTAAKDNEGPSLMSDIRIHFGTGYNCGAGIWVSNFSQCPPM